MRSLVVEVQDEILLSVVPSRLVSLFSRFGLWDAASGVWSLPGDLSLCLGAPTDAPVGDTAQFWKSSLPRPVLAHWVDFHKARPHVLAIDKLSKVENQCLGPLAVVESVASVDTRCQTGASGVHVVSMEPPIL